MTLLLIFAELLPFAVAVAEVVLALLARSNAIDRGRVGAQALGTGLYADDCSKTLWRQYEQPGWLYLFLTSG